MHLAFQWYDIDVQYKQGKEMTMPDTLSRAFFNTPEMQESEMIISMLQYVTISEEKYAELQQCTQSELYSPTISEEKYAELQQCTQSVVQLGTDHTQRMA